MNRIFHRAKHWQLFTILVGSFVIFQLLAMFYMNVSMNEVSTTPRFPDFSKFLLFFIPMMLILLVMTSGWQWSIGSGLKDKLPQGVRLNFRLYRVFTIVPILYILFHVGFIFFLFSRMENAFTTGNPFAALQIIFPMMIGMMILIPFGLFAIFCMFYTYYFCAKTLKSIELGREAELNDYIGYFFLFWIQFVGYWIIQPSVNQITAEGWIPPPTPPGYEPLVGTDSMFEPIPKKEVVPPGAKLKTKDHEAFDHDDDFDGLF